MPTLSQLRASIITALDASRSDIVDELTYRHNDSLHVVGDINLEVEQDCDDPHTFHVSFDINLPDMAVGAAKLIGALTKAIFDLDRDYATKQ